MTPHRLRYNALLVAIVGLEAVWVSLWSRVLGPPPDGGAVPWLPLWIVGAVLILWNHWLWRRKNRAFSFLGAFVLITLLMLGLAPEEVGFLGLAAWPRAIIGAWDFLARPVPLTIIAAAGLVLWVRTVRMMEEPLSLLIVEARLRRNALYIGAAMIAALIRGVPLPPSQGFIFFAFALLAVALARADTVSQLPEVGRLPFDGRWVANLFGGIILALTLGLFATILFSVRGMAFLADLFRPLTLAVSWLAAQVLAVVASFLGGLIGDLYASVPPAPPPVAVTPVPTPALSNPASTVGLPADDIVFLVGVVLTALVLLYLAYQLLLHTPIDGDDMEVEGAEAEYGRVPIHWDPGDWLRRQTAGLSDRFRRSPRPEFGIESVRDLYKNLLLFGDEHGLPRPVEQTPYEYLRPLAQQYPQRRDDFRTLTDAYVATHYGERDFSRVEVERLQAAWRRIASETPSIPSEAMP